MLLRPLLYYITDRRAFAGDEPSQRRRLLEKIAEAARCGVDYIQLREKDLSTRELEKLAREAVAVVKEEKKRATGTRKLAPALLVNSRTDVALAVEADGIHLRSDDVPPAEVRYLWTRGEVTPAIIAVSCHSAAEVVQAASEGATFAVFAPVFEKKDSPETCPSGLAALEQACRAKIPVLALGGVTLENAPACVAVGAAGIAGIRLFQENDIGEVVRKLR